MADKAAPAASSLISATPARIDKTSWPSAELASIHLSQFISTSRQTGQSIPVPNLAQVNSIRQLAPLIGNRALQRALLPQSTTAATETVIQRDTIWEQIRAWWESIFTEDREEVISDIDSGLEHSADVLRAGIDVMARTPAQRRRIESAIERIERLQGMTGRVVSAIEAANVIFLLDDLRTAINDVPDNIADDPGAAADAFGRMFATIGRIGEELPDGPWTPYCTFLAGMEGFFTNMLNALDPGRRWADEFEAIEREGAYTSERGLSPRGR